MQEVQKLSEIIKTDQLKYQSQALIAQMNNASKERIADIQEKAALIATEAKIQAQNAQLQLTTEIERINQQLGMLHEHVMADKQHQQAQQLADQQAQQAQQSQEADQQHQQDMAQQAQEAQAQQPEGNDARS
jgi:uncharacterized protein (DUF2141 family)